MITVRLILLSYFHPVLPSSLPPAIHPFSSHSLSFPSSHLFQVYIEALRTMHLNTISALGLPTSTITSIEELLEDLSKLLEGVEYEITP